MSDDMLHEPETTVLVKGRKRQKLDTSRPSMSYPRKRAVTACHLCRVRKTKCNNERPTCSSCMSLGAQCGYDDSLDHSSFDPASLLILQKLNEISTRLDNGLPAGAHLEQNALLGFTPQSTVDSSGRNLSHGTLSGAGFSHPALAVDGDSTQDDSAFDYLKVPSSRLTPDSVLMWPIFQHRFHHNCLIEAVFVPEGSEKGAGGNLMTQQQKTRARNQTGPIHDEDAPALVKNFLTFVHIKNPILDPKTIMEYARSFAEYGPNWDAPSCLVLLACALGTIARPFDATPLDSELETVASTSARLDDETKQIAEIYFTMARKRFGLLGRNIITSQCYLLSGVYLMYMMQPLEAWNDFLQASVSYHIYLKCNAPENARLSHTSTQFDSKTRRLEQRLYWTCFKSECEIRAEMSLPESGISDLRYPYMFPSPPTPASPVAQEQTTSMPSYTSASPQSAVTPAWAEDLDRSQQQSWFYYLTEISLRRIGNRVINAFYQAEHYSWTNRPLSEMARTAEHFEEQLEEWYNGLPEPIQYDQIEPLQTLDELRFLVKARFLEVKNWLYRPFLYCGIHSRDDPETQNFLRPWVAKAMENIMEKSKMLSIPHRHHGAWYACRSVTAAALMTIAAAKSQQLEMPHDWHRVVFRAIATLSHWEAESPDLAKAMTIVQELYSEVIGT